MNAVIYARFSSDRQNDMSIRAQVRACKEYAKNHDLNVIEVYTDEAISGSTTKRPGYQALLSDAFENKFDVILIHKYDRIARDLAEQATLDKKLTALGIRLIAVAQDFGDSKEAKLSKGIQWILGEYYLANLAEETRKGLKEVALQGKFTGGVAPFGYDIVDGRYVINPIEAEYVKKLFKTVIAGNSIQPVLDEMKKAGIKGKRGKEIKHPQAYDILHNEKYTGVYKYCPVENKTRADRRAKTDGIEVEGAIPRIIDPGDFKKAAQVMSTRKVSEQMKHKCSGLIYCRKCGSKMHLATYQRKDGPRQIFRCSNRGCAFSVPAEVIDQTVHDYMQQFFKPEVIKEVNQYLKDYKETSVEEEKAFKISQAKMIADKQKELNNLVDVFTKGFVTDVNAEYINKELKRVRDELDSIKRMQPPRKPPKERIVLWLEKLKKSEETPKLFIERIDVGPDGSNSWDISIRSNFASEVLGEDADVDRPLGRDNTFGDNVCKPPQPLYPKVMLSFDSKARHNSFFKA